LQQVQTRTRLINIDETWLGMSDFRRMKWQQPPALNSVPKSLWHPRISMILAIDSYGQQYVSLAQANTNDSMMELFIRDLVRQLTEEDRRFRQNTLIVIDGAPYHQSKATRALMAELQLPLMISGPHSYDASPCEQYFAQFKKADINPRKIKCGKR
jgi:hypothetical protein